MPGEEREEAEHHRGGSRALGVSLGLTGIRAVCPLSCSGLTTVIFEAASVKLKHKIG